MNTKSIGTCNRLFGALFLAMALIAAGCGGGGGGGPANGGSGGTGAGNPVTARSSGEIEAFGSIIVNGTRFEIESVELEIEGQLFPNQGQAGVEDRLRPGMIVAVEAEGTDDNTVRRAVRIRFDDTLEGPISAIVETVPGAVGSDGVRVDFSTGGIQLEEVERRLILEALRASAWKRGRAAQLLGISKETLRYRMEKHQLHPPA